MTIVRLADDAKLRAVAAEILAEELGRKPDLALVAAAGELPQRVYSSVSAILEGRKIPTDRTVIVQLDEVMGLAPEVPESRAALLRNQVCGPWRIAPGNFWAWNGVSPDPQRDCTAFSDFLALRGGADLGVLDLGSDGRLGLNEPSDRFIPGAHPVFPAPTAGNHEKKPSQSRSGTGGLTLGLAEILQTRKILFLASGAQNRGVFQRLLRGRVDPRLPASLLWLHGDVTCLATEELFS